MFLPVVLLYLLFFSYLKPDQTERINGWPQYMHLAEQGVSRGRVVLSRAFGDQDLGVRGAAVLRGVWAGECADCLTELFSVWLTNTFEIVKVVPVEGRDDLADNNENAEVRPWALSPA